MSKIQAVGNKVIVKPQTPPEVTEGGIIIPESAKNQLPQSYGEVISVGDDVANQIQAGDIAVYHTFKAGMDILHERVIYKVLIDNEIYGIIKKEQTE